jgi:hypothetical protein
MFSAASRPLENEVKVEETFVERLAEAGSSRNCSTIRSILEQSSDLGNICLRLFCYTSRCDRVEFGVGFLFIQGLNSRVLVGCSYRFCGMSVS